MLYTLEFVRLQVGGGQLELEVVVHDEQFFFELVLFETHPTFEIGTVLSGALEAVHRVPFLVGLDEDGVEHLLLTLVAEMCRVVLSPAVIPNLDIF